MYPEKPSKKKRIVDGLPLPRPAPFPIFLLPRSARVALYLIRQRRGQHLYHPKDHANTKVGICSLKVGRKAVGEIKHGFVSDGDLVGISEELKKMVEVAAEKLEIQAKEVEDRELQTRLLMRSRNGIKKIIRAMRHRIWGGRMEDEAKLAEELLSAFGGQGRAGE